MGLKWNCLHSITAASVPEQLDHMSPALIQSIFAQIFRYLGEHLEIFHHVTQICEHLPFHIVPTSERCPRKL